MLVLVTYDVCTETNEGKARLRKAAKVCLNYGQRVQKSVFECRVSQMECERLKQDLKNTVNLVEDNLRFYRLQEPLSKNVEEYGTFRATDFEKDVLIF